MYTLIIAFIILLSILLILVVIAQNPKGGGLSSQFGGSGVSQVMGVKKTGDILEKLTWGFAIGIFLLALSSNLFINENTKSGESPNIQNAQDQSALPNSQQLIDSDPLEPALNDLDLLSAPDSSN